MRPTSPECEPGENDLVTPVLAFFAERGRDLPWRRPDAGPWAVLVSEVMLQQTPVVRVLPVYLEWLSRWPTPAALAADSPGEAVRAWGRLGYPRRALRLYAAATEIALRPDGALPRTVEELRQLPGVGEYTARAVAAFAFGARTPVVDTNVRRVMSRVLRGRDSIREPATAADRLELSELLPVDPARAARFSAALMELGALVCSAAHPRCDSCPVQDICSWRQAGYPEGTARRQVQAWHGTDRQARGAMMRVLRESRGPVPESEVLDVCPDPDQAQRCLHSLIADGLAVREHTNWIVLPN